MMRKNGKKLGNKRRVKCDHCGRRRVCKWSKAYDPHEEKIVGLAWFCSETPEG